MVEFAGFDMPVQYEGILAEHRAVRERAGLFDVSHMGQIHLDGPGAVAAVERLVTCPVASLGVGRVRYGLLCNERGGVVDDVTVYRLADESLFLCVNAANVEKDWTWIRKHVESASGVATSGVELEDRSEATGLLALQGPESADVLAAVSGDGVRELKRFRVGPFEVAGAPAWISRTGYTGSDGFEIYLPADRSEAAFDALLAAGEPRGLRPAGLGARDTLRLEAALPLYGHELDDDTSPLEAGLERFVKREAGGFVGAEAIERRAAAEPTRRLVGLVLEGRGVARAGHEIADGADVVGAVTSGAPSPTLGKSIALGYVRAGLEAPGTALDIRVRGRTVPARVVETPFVARGSG